MTNEEAIRELMFAKREVMADSFIDKAYDKAIEALKITSKFAETLAQTELTVPCDERPDDDWCAEHCQYAEPQKLCWIRWAQGVLGLPLTEVME